MATPSQLEAPLEKLLSEEIWGKIPAFMEPGTVFFLEGTGLGDPQNPFVAAMSCPRCGTIGLITAKQMYYAQWMICAGETCSAEWRNLPRFLDDEYVIDARPTQ